MDEGGDELMMMMNWLVFLPWSAFGLLFAG